MGEDSGEKVKSRKSLWRKIVPTLILAVLVFFFLGVYADFNKLLRSLRDFQIFFLLPILFLALLNYVIRFLRWHYYLKVLDFEVELKESATIFFTGLAMSITPGKLGELLKCLLLKEKNGIGVSASAPVVISERYTDLLAVLMLLGIGATFYSAGRIVLAIGFALVLILFFGFTSTDFFVNKLGFFLSKFSLGTFIIQGAQESGKSFRELLKGKRLIFGTFLGILAWFCECLAFYLVFLGFRWYNLSLFSATFIYALSTLAGALSMLPGGLGVTEGSMTALLVIFHLRPDVSAATTLIIRACTLWFAVIVGLFSYFLHRKVVKRTMEEVLEGKFSGEGSSNAH